MPMSIPKGFILYKAERHHENLPINRKYGYYSDKLYSSVFNLKKPYTNFHRRYKKRFVQEIRLAVDDKSLETNQARRVLSKYNHIKKFTIRPVSCFMQLPRPAKFTKKGFRMAFKILKRIKDLKLYFSGQFEKPACKNLLLLNKLETLSLPHFSYSEKSNNKPIFTRTIKLAAKRRNWKSFKSLNIGLSSKTSHTNLDYYEDSMKRLLDSMRFWKKYCWDIYKCSSFQLELPPEHRINWELPHLLTEIAQIAPSLTKINGCDIRRFSTLSSESLNQTTGLKEILLTFTERLQHDPYLGLSYKIPNVQALTLDISEYQSTSLSNCRDVLKQIQTLKNLTSLSLKFHKMPVVHSSLQENQTSDLTNLISELANLKSLELVFGVGPCNNEKYRGDYCGLFLKDIFKAIGEKSKLEKLLLSFATFNFDSDTRSIWKSLCQCVQKLTGLSVLKLEMRTARPVENEYVLTLGQSLGLLTKMQDLSLKISKQFYFKVKTLLALLDGFVNNLPLLSRLDLKMSSVRTTHESSKALAETLNRMKCLNWICLDLTGEIDWDLDLRTLQAQINKKIQGNIYHTKVYQP